MLNKCALEEIDDSDIVDFIDFNVDSETSEGKSPRVPNSVQQTYEWVTLT